MILKPEGDFRAGNSTSLIFCIIYEEGATKLYFRLLLLLHQGILVFAILPSLHEMKKKLNIGALKTCHIVIRHQCLREMYIA